MTKHQSGIPGSDSPLHYDEDAAAIYGEHYAARYAGLYTAPWRRKHELDAANLTNILDNLPTAQPSWLDLACGQAWHFCRFPGRAHMIGLDLSWPQLTHAKANAPHARFVRADMLRAPFAPQSFDLVTNFWAGYCYLASQDRIGSLLSEAVRWLRPGGALYFEILQPRDLASFNDSRFSAGTGFTVVPRTEDYREWRYDDVGGRHLMTSPPLEFFLDTLSPEFHQIDARHDSAFMIHLMATRRRG